MGSRFSALSLATFKIIFQQDEITLQLKLLDMYNELLQNPFKKSYQIKVKGFLKT